MTTDAAAGLLTAADLWQLPDDGNRYELSDGRLVCMAPASNWSAIVAGNVLEPLRAHVRAHDLGVCGVEGGFVLRTNPDVVRTPDVWFVRRERVPPIGQRDGYWPFAPDLAVEILSPTDRAEQIRRKLVDYLDAGTRLVWLLDPRRRSAAVFRPDDALPRLLSGDDALDGEDVLPGFTLPLAEVFHD
jgi:Uma2 family endonuclease